MQLSLSISVFYTEMSCVCGGGGQGFNKIRLGPLLRELAVSCLQWNVSLSTKDIGTVSASLGVLYHLCHFFSLAQLLTIFKDIVCPCMEYESHGGEVLYLVFLNRVVEGSSSHQFPSSYLTVYLL